MGDVCSSTLELSGRKIPQKEFDAIEEMEAYLCDSEQTIKSSNLQVCHRQQ